MRHITETVSVEGGLSGGHANVFYDGEHVGVFAHRSHDRRKGFSVVFNELGRECLLPAEASALASAIGEYRDSLASVGRAKTGLKALALNPVTSVRTGEKGREKKSREPSGRMQSVDLTRLARYDS